MKLEEKTTVTTSKAQDCPGTSGRSVRLVFCPAAIRPCGDRKEMNMNFKRLAALVCAALMLLSLAACGSEEQPPPSDPVTITIWTYYNGSQLEAFTDLITRFNDTVGRENSITVESYSQSSVADLEKNVVESAEGKAVADRAEVLSRMEAGQSFEQASAEFLSDECFESWYQDVLTQLEAYEG